MPAKSYTAQTSIRFREINAIEEWADVRRLLGLDLPVRPIGGPITEFRHPDHAEWQSDQQAALARGGEHAQAVASFFLQSASAKESSVVDAPFNAVISLGQFCAEIENQLPKEQKPLVVIFYSRCTKRHMTVVPRTQFQDEWERYINTVAT